MNDNAGVVAAGLGVGINRNLTRIRGDNAEVAAQLKNLHRIAVQDKRDATREKAAKELVFRVHTRLTTLPSRAVSANLYYQVQRLAREVYENGISSESFGAFQDKDFFCNVESELHRLNKAIDGGLPPATKAHILELNDWYKFYRLAYAVATADAAADAKSMEQKQMTWWSRVMLSLGVGDIGLARGRQREMDFLKKQRASLAATMCDITSVPDATRAYFASHCENRLGKLQEILEYVQALCEFLGVSPDLLPDVPELKWLQLCLDVVPPWPQKHATHARQL